MSSASSSSSGLDDLYDFCMLETVSVRGSSCSDITPIASSHDAIRSASYCAAIVGCKGAPLIILLLLL